MNDVMSQVVEVKGRTQLVHRFLTRKVGQAYL